MAKNTEVRSCKKQRKKDELKTSRVKEKRRSKNFVVDPDTKRWIQINGATFNELRRKYHFDIKKNIFVISRPGTKSKNNRVKRYAINPLTKRQIIVNGPTFKRLLSKYRYDSRNMSFIIPKSNNSASIIPNATGNNQAKKFVVNPDTRRRIRVYGSVFKRLIQKYKYDEERNTFHNIDETRPTFDGKYWEINEPDSTENTAERLIIEERNKYGVQKESRYLKMDFYNCIDSLDKIHKALDNVYRKENNAIKINIAFGYATEKEKNIKLIKPGYNYFFDAPRVIKNASDLNILKKSITEDSIMETLNNQFPDSQTILLGVYAMAVKITRLDFPIGARIVLPPYIKDSRFINALEEVDNNMCFWACIALSKGFRKDRYVKKANTLFTEFYAHRKTRTLTDYPGFDYINELERYEAIDTSHAINIVSLYDDESISYIRKSKFNQERPPIYLNLYLNHFSYITDFQKLAKVYLCTKCDTKCRNNYEMLLHLETCTIKQEDKFLNRPKLWEKSRNIIVELSEYYGADVDFKYDYLITFDLESINQKIIEKAGEKLTYVGRHIPVSASIATNVPGFEEIKFILTENPRELTRLMFEYFDEISIKAKEIMLQKMKPLLDRLESKSQVESYCSSIPIVGFNSGFYDINLLSNDGFINEIIARDAKPFVIKEGNRYKIVKTKDFMFLDQMNYCAPGTSLSGFIKAYDIDENKGWFPYEWFDSYAKLDYPVKNLQISDFYSSLKCESMSQSDFKRLMKICEEKNLILVKDLLKWYNNLDVGPMLKACLKQKDFFYTFKLDIYKDGFSLPALSENILYQFQLEGFDEYLKQKPEKPEEPLSLSKLEIEKRIAGYKKQDTLVERDPTANVTIEDVKYLLERERYCCYYCWKPLRFYDWSLDRLDCIKSHTKTNCVASCVNCNKARSDKPYKEFYRRKALLRWEKEHPMIWLFAEENKDAFYKFKTNVTGGASIVFHRYHEKDKTQITRTHYDQKEWTYDKEGKTVKKIVGYDANALYLYCLGEEMACGKLYWKENNDWEKYQKEVATNKFFGFLEVDIHVPEDKWNYFSEMCPIFVNKEYNEEVCGQYTKDLLEKLGRKPTKSRKLISTLKAEKILIKSTRLRWLMEHGCVVSKLHGVIEAKRGRVFKGFMNWVTNERRKGDIDLKYAIIGEVIKNVGNSAFGRTGMDKNKHKKVKFCTEVQFNRAKNNYFYYDAEEYDGVYVVVKRAKTVLQNMPIQIACSVYDDSKLRMLQFYYDCIDKYIDRSDFQYIEMDTDSAYIALTGDFESMIKPEFSEEFKIDKCNWFPRNDTEENKKFDKRKPGLFKIEYEGDGMVALCSKTYCVWGDKNKISSKGLQRRRNPESLNKESYLRCLFNRETINGENKGFRFTQRIMKTYEQNKIGLSPIYTKGVVMSDGIHIRPIQF
jgi:hypothetical protein